MIGGFGKINKNIIKTNNYELLAKESRILVINNSVESNQDISDKSKLGPYIAGLIAIHDAKSNAKKYRPKILVVFHKDNKPLADRLCLITNAGTVYEKTGGNYVI